MSEADTNICVLTSLVLFNHQMYFNKLKLNLVLDSHGECNTVNFMVTPCINNIQHFNFQLMHTTLKKRRVIRTF